MGGIIDHMDKMNEQYRKDHTFAPAPIKIFTVCVNSELGGEKYMAFLGSDPSKKATASTRDQAIVDLLTEQKLIVVVEND